MTEQKIGDYISDCVNRQSFTAKDMEIVLALIKEAGYVQLAEDQTFPAFITPGGIGWDQLLQAMRDADYRAGFRRVKLEK